jgi:competence protein ComEA
MDSVRQYGLFLVIACAGLALFLYGLAGQLVPPPAVVEIVKRGEQETRAASGQIIVDVAGSVEQPGVYTLPSGSRIGDALVVAGGLSVNADREWVAQRVNLAEQIKDAQKIYIPAEQENATLQSSGRINVNTASVGELDALAGIGEVRAQAIINSRPYSQIEELVSRVYDQIKDQISVY